MKPAASARAIVEAATVWLPEMRGQGVLVPGGFVLTAAHCIEFPKDGGMALGDYVLATVKPRGFRKFRMSVAAVEFRADVAVLMEADGGELWKDYSACFEWSERTRPVPLLFRAWRQRRPVPVHVLSHRGKWSQATATRWNIDPCSSVALSTKHKIEGGTSGGPIVTQEGLLAGIVSHSHESDEPGADLGGGFPVPALALPAWVIERIRRAEARR